jgi:hypothetical protein
MWYLDPDYLMGNWQPRIGDPSFMGWLTVASYFACAMIAWVVALSARHRGGRTFRFWSVIFFLMILLGINKQLDLQSLFTEVGRQIAIAQGWMVRRRVVQFWFIVAFGTAAIAGALSFAILMRRLFRRFRLAFMGLFFLTAFIVIRAVSFHHVDMMLRYRFFGARMNWVLELTGIYLIAIAGYKEIIQMKKVRARVPG